MHPPTNPTDRAALIAALLPKMSSEDVAARLNCHRRTVLDIARANGVPIRPRGCNVKTDTPTTWNPHKRTWPFKARGVAALNWC
jgi:hypothetical protein